MTKKRHKTKDKGDLALAHVIADLRKHLIISCLPISEHLPFDLIAVMPDMETLLRVQVKYRSGTKQGCITVEFKNNYYDSQKIYYKYVDFNDIDAYAVYIPDIDKVCYFNVDDLSENARTLTLRFEAPKNNQRKGVNLVADFIDPISMASKKTLHQQLRLRNVSPFDEIAIAQATLDLQKQGIRPHIPTSQYTPFDLLGIYPDMCTMKRYRIGYETVQPTEFIDEYIIYDPKTEQCIFLNACDIEKEIDILKVNTFIP